MIDYDEIEYNTDLINRCISISDASSSLAKSEFYSLTTDLLSDVGVISDTSETESFSHRNKKEGTQIDGWAWNELEKSIYGIVTEFSDDASKIEPINKQEIETLGKRVSKLLTSIDNTSFLEQVGYDTASRLADISSRINEAIKFKIIIITNKKLTTRVRSSGISLESIYDRDTSIEVFDLAYLFDIEQGNNENANTLIDFEELFDDGLIALSSNSSPTGQKSFLCVMPADYLSEIYHRWGQRLLQSNVRSFLEFRGLSNKGMKECLLKEPENFFVYNNGITVTASDLKTKRDGNHLKIVQLENMQIVNGGQTTCCIYFAPKENKGPGSVGGNLKWSDIDLKKASVQMKLTILDGENAEYNNEMTANISRYSNTQAAVQAADLISNHPFHRRIEDLSRKTHVSGQDGIPSKWFYERSRGQYNVALRQKRTPSAKRGFQSEYPKSQKFVKTDLAKYENTWRRRPFEVCKGAQKNLALLGSELIKEWERTDDNFREPFYKKLIAKAILFKSLDSEINKAEWYKQERGYKALTVTYTIAWLRNSLLEKKVDIDLNKIFRNQKLSQELLNELLNIARTVRANFMDMNFRNGVSNISEFAKKPIAWDELKKISIPCDIKENDLLNEKQIKRQRDQEKDTVKTSAEVDVITRILNIKKEEWLDLIRYLNENDNLPYDHKNISLINLCVGLHNGEKMPTEKQASAAIRIHAKANAESWSFL